MSRPIRRTVLLLIAGLASSGGFAASAEEDGVRFLDPLNGEPLEFTFRPDQEITSAVETMHATGENPYVGDEEAIAAGEALYEQYCQACHLPDGSGRIGPSLIDDRHTYERTGTQKGMFEIVYAGGAGAMQAFGRRIDQDQILEVLAYLETLREE